jgi:anti-sigma regulatory factor (Ser/Thr protein kinase)
MTSGERMEFVHRSWPADPAQLFRIRRELAGWLGPLHLSTEEIERIVLAVDEAAANAVCHAYGPGESGIVELTLWTEEPPESRGTTLCIEVVDHGSWRTPAEKPVSGGRGIALIRAMTDATLIHYDDRGSRVLLRHGVRSGRGVRGARGDRSDREAGGPGTA